MDEEFKKLLIENGADVETTIKRFMGNEGLYLKFLMKFPDDKNYESIQEHYRKAIMKPRLTMRIH